MMMFILAILIAISGVVVISSITGARLYGGIAIAVAAVLGLASFVTIVPAGHVGVKVLFGAVQTDTLDEGLHLVNPFMTIYQMSAKTQTYTMSGAEEKEGHDKGSIASLSKDGLRIPVDVSIVYRLDPTYASWVIQNIGYDYQDILLQPAARAAVREAISNYTAQESYSTKRGELAVQMEDSLRTSLAKILAGREFNETAIHVQDVLLRNVDLPQKVKSAIEEKLEADQAAQKMVFVLQKERQEAERKQVEAEGIQKFQEIVQRGISEQLLRWKGIEATENIAKSPNSKVIIIGGGRDGTPIILNTEQNNKSE